MSDRILPSPVAPESGRPPGRPDLGSRPRRARAACLASLALLAPATRLSAQPAWHGGETPVGDPSLAGANVGSGTLPHALGVLGIDGADTLIAWEGTVGAWAQRFGPDGASATYPFAGPGPVSGLELARTTGGATLASWIDDGRLTARRLQFDGPSFPVFFLPDDSVADTTVAGATVASLPGGDLLVARNRRVAGDPEYPELAAWRETVVLRRHGRFGHPRGPSIALTESIFSCAAFTFCGQQTWGTPRIALGRDSALVVWQRTFANGRPLFDSGSLDLYARLLDADGAPVGETIIVNEFRDAGMSEPQVAALPDGGFALVWTSSPSFSMDRTSAQDGDAGAIVLRLLEADGAPRGLERIVNSTTAGDQRQPSLAVTADGTILVAWRHGTTETRAQRLGPDGEPLGAEITVNTAGPDVAAPSVAAADGGSFVVAWQRLRYDGESRPTYSIASQRLSFPSTPSPLAIDTPPILLTGEDGAVATFTVALASPPTAVVTVPVVPWPPQPASGEVAVDPTELVFGPDDWDLPQTVIVTGLDDGVIDGDQPLALRLGPLASIDPVFDSRLPGDLRVLNRELGCRLVVYANGQLIAGRAATFRFGAEGDACGERVAITFERDNELHDLGEHPIAPDDYFTTPVRVDIPATATPAQGWRLRVATRGEPSFSGLSEPIHLLAQQCRLDLRAPDGGERWLRGTPRAIRWRTFGNGCGPLVELELLRAGTFAAYLGVTDNDGIFIWQVPADIARDKTYRVRIRSLLRPEVSDSSDRVFSIAGR